MIDYDFEMPYEMANFFSVIPAMGSLAAFIVLVVYWYKHGCVSSSYGYSCSADVENRARAFMAFYFLNFIFFVSLYLGPI